MIGGAIIPVVLGCGIVAALAGRAWFRANPFKLSDDTLSDDAYGDWPAVPDDFKTSVHFTPLTKGSAQDHV